MAELNASNKELHECEIRYRPFRSRGFGLTDGQITKDSTGTDGQKPVDRGGCYTDIKSLSIFASGPPRGQRVIWRLSHVVESRYL